MYPGTQQDMIKKQTNADTVRQTISSTDNRFYSDTIILCDLSLEEKEQLSLSMIIIRSTLT